MYVMKIQNLLILAGTGNKSGKTSMACRIIDRYRALGVIALKITPHFHETTPGLDLLIEKPGLSVYEETNASTSKDTSRMLRAGAARVFYAKVTDDTLHNAFNEVFKLIPGQIPVICESPALRHHVDPGLFILMNSPVRDNQKDISLLSSYDHLEYSLDELSSGGELPFGFSYGIWFSLRGLRLPPGYL